MSFVVVTEEGKNTDNQAHPHKQRQGDPEKTPTQGKLGPKATKKNQDLLHPPAKIMNSYSMHVIFKVLSTVKHVRYAS